MVYISYVFFSVDSIIDLKNRFDSMVASPQYIALPIWDSVIRKHKTRRVWDKFYLFKYKYIKYI
jgi:hypothetical protein